MSKVLTVFEIEAEIKKQKQIIEHSHRNITSSITYASRIQDALLPNIEILNNVLPENFILWKPRDIISGDFYWFKQIKNNLFT